MIVTARQLEDLHRQNGGNGHVVLPYRARLTPLAQDWLKARRVAVGYSDVARQADGATTAAPDAPKPACPACSHAGGFVWWCDGPCGPAKAALTGFEKESGLRPLAAPAGAGQTAAVVKRLAGEVKSGRAAGGVLMVQNAAVAIVYANRCPSLRAVLGTCQEAVEQGVQQVAANVLVIEYPYKTLQQMKNMLGRFLKAKRELNEDARRQLQELASCA